MRTEKTVIFEGKPFRSQPRARSRKSFLGLPDKVEEPDIAFIIKDIFEAIQYSPRTEFYVTPVNVFENIPRYSTVSVSNDERHMSHEEFMAEVKKLLTEQDLSWLDTDQFSLEWSDLHSRPKTEILEMLNASPISRAYIGILRKDGKNEYLIYSISD